MKKKIRIAILGANNSGKRRLCNDFSEATNIPIADLPITKIAEKYHLTTKESVVKQSSTSPKEGIRFTTDLIMQRERLVKSTQNDLITTDTCLETYILYLIFNSFWDVSSHSLTLKKLTLSNLREFTHIFLVKGSYPFLTTNEEHTINPVFHQMYQDLLISFLKKYITEIIYPINQYISQDARNAEESKHMVVEHMRRIVGKI